MTYQKAPTPIPIIEFFRLDGQTYKHENIQLTVWDNLQIFDHHRLTRINASDPDVNRSPRGVFVFSDRKWWFRNQSGETVFEVDQATGQKVPHPSGDKPFRVYNNMQLIMSEKPEGRLALFRFLNA